MNPPQGALQPTRTPSFQTVLTHLEWICEQMAADSLFQSLSSSMNTRLTFPPRSSTIAHKLASSINWLLTLGRANTANTQDNASEEVETIARSPLTLHRRPREVGCSFPAVQSEDERRILHLDKRERLKSGKFSRGWALVPPCWRSLYSVAAPPADAKAPNGHQHSKSFAANLQQKQRKRAARMKPARRRNALFIY